MSLNFSKHYIKYIRRPLIQKDIYFFSPTQRRFDSNLLEAPFSELSRGKAATYYC